MLGKIRTFILQIRSLTLYPVELQAQLQAHQYTHIDMIQTGTYVNVLDNTGVKKAKCIQVPKGKQYADLGSLIVVVVRERRKNTRRSRGEKLHAIVVQTRSQESRIDGSKLTYGQNGVVLISPSSGNPLGTRVLDAISISVRHRAPSIGVKLLSLTKRVY